MRDERAYRQLFIHYYNSLLRFATGIVGTPELAEEIISDVMMRVWDMGSRLSQVDNLKVYLFTSVKNAAFTELDKRKRHIPTTDAQNGEDVAENTPNPERQMLLSELEQKIEQAVMQLPPKCQAVYRLIKEEGCTYKEAAAILEISGNTIEGHMQTAFQRIKAATSLYLHGIK
ncbi:MAG: RNA polymerase sigma-70 factor [Filimonas sp.]|nr:RNA polymerase sigma-70 factor [Filimonas sp.]